MLPVRAIQDELLSHLAAGPRLIVEAPTGSGKSTQVPRMLLEAGVIAGRIIVLQPRRLAARLLAVRVAREMGQPLGQTVGYHVRHERIVGDESRIVFMTEGMLLRLMQQAPHLPGVGAVLLDEFHERSLAADMILALVRKLQQGARADLKLLVMSATLDATALAEAIDAQKVRARERLHPVETGYLIRPDRRPVWQLAAEALDARIEAGLAGDVLIFMPGVYEIRRTVEACRAVAARRGLDAELLPLHANLPPAEQDRAVSPAGGRRRVVVATNVAQTSITIEGVRHVIDSGLARIHRHDARRAINVLRIEPVSQAAADQRAGRAGRTAPGTCDRLWTQADHARRAQQDVAEVHRVDFAEALLQLAALGIDDIAALPWLEPPAPATLERAATLLRELGAMDGSGSLTPRGRRMAHLPVHPRLGRVLLEAARRGCLGRAAVWVAIISERNVLSGAVGGELCGEALSCRPVSDLYLRELACDRARRARFNPQRLTALGIVAGACREVCRTAKLLYRQAMAVASRRMKTARPADTAGDVDADDPHPPPRPDTEALVRSLLPGFFDHLLLRPDEHRRHCTSPEHARLVLDEASLARRAGLLLALELRQVGEGDRGHIIVSLASEVEPAWVEQAFAGRIEHRSELVWNEQTRAVEQLEQRLYRGLPLTRTRRPAPPGPDAATMLADRIVDGTLKLAHWNEKVEQWIARVRSVAAWLPQRKLLLYEPEDIRLILLEIIGDATRYSQVQDRPCLDAVVNAMSHDDQQWVRRMAPASVELPGGGRMRLHYEPGQPPRGRAKIQALYGLEHSPRIAGGRVAVRIEILGPHGRPVQITDDLGNFWQTLYPQLRNELRRRYPRHEWR